MGSNPATPTNSCVNIAFARPTADGTGELGLRDRMALVKPIPDGGGVASTGPAPHPGLSFLQFVVIVAALMACNALAIDSMLPALQAIGEQLGIVNANTRQWIITAYLLGFGMTQIIYGTLADRYGRKPVLLVGICIYAVASLAASFATSFGIMMAFRVLQGVGAAATRVLAVSIVRDCYSGRKMARVMSFAFIVFLATPIVAPSIGQAIMLVAPWPWIFRGLALFGAVLWVVVALRLPETLDEDDRLPIAADRVARAFGAALGNRTAVGYMLASAVVIGALFGFINSAQQIFADAFKAPGMFTIVFASVAMFMALSSLLNARIVIGIGTRLVSHAALAIFTLASAIHAAIAVAGFETLWVFAIFQAVTMFCFGLVAPNFGSISMEPLGHIAGTASSVQGVVTTVGGAVIGFFIGQHFDGTVVPFTVAVTVCGASAFLIVLVTEKGRMFRPHHPVAAETRPLLEQK